MARKSASSLKVLSSRRYMTGQAPMNVYHFILLSKEDEAEIESLPGSKVKIQTPKIKMRGEVTVKGSEWNLLEGAVHVTFHKGAVLKPLFFTCSVSPPKLCSPPISSDELLVSNVIELSHDGPPDLEFSGDEEGKVTVALLHSASDLKGYEVVIKQLVDPHDNVWKDLKTWHASEKPEVSDWPRLVEATCTLSKCSSFAAIWRLKSFTFTRCTSVAPQFTCIVPDFPDICVEVPLSSIPDDQDFTLTIKVQEFPSNETEDIGILCGPVIHISSSQNIAHMEPVTIKVPLTLCESKQDFSELSNEAIRIIYLDSEGKPSKTSWTDITGQPVTLKDGNVEFKVKHFCGFCVCVFNERDAVLEDFFCHLFFRPLPQRVHFLTCLCETTVPDTYALLLYCYPNFKKVEVEKKLSRYDIPYKGEGKSKELAYVGDEIVVSPSGLDFVRESQRKEKVVLRFLGNDISDNSDMALIVRMDRESVPTVKFYKEKEQQNLLCEVPILKTRPAFAVTVGTGQSVVPEERPASAKDSDTGKEDFGFIERGAKQKVSKNTTTEKKKARAATKTNKKEKNEKASGSNEVKQEEESDSAIEKPKLNPIGEPGTSGVSNTCEKRKFKEGVVSNVDLQTLGKAIGAKWDRLARRLPGITEDDMEGIEDRYKTLSQKGFHTLKLWKTMNGEAADYQTLYDALVQNLVQGNDLAEKYCLE
ncbi:uncharacterized protein [Pocillopora verrucosa]|uniref:uncharacterized protein isoform X2 n=1 Tax=Pocillopora verrucosa TaxID=203993 RepID=UPI003342293E